MGKRSLRILLVDEDDEIEGLIKERIRRISGVSFIGACKDSGDVEAAVISGSPDAVVVDLFISGKYDGFWVIDRLRDIPGDIRCIIAVSCIKNESIIKNAMQHGADYYLKKPFDIDILIARIQEMCGAADGGDEKEDGDEHILEQDITAFLLNVGITPNLSGFQYLRYGIWMGIVSPDMLSGVTKVLYPEIARNFSTTGSKVERAISHAIAKMWKTGRGDIYCRVMGCPPLEKKPTNSHFISSAVEYFKMKT